MKKVCIALASLTFLIPLVAAAKDESEAKTIKKLGDLDWARALSDVSSGSVSASSMLDLSGDSIKNVENVRDLVLAVKGLGSGDSKATIGIAVTPARGVFPMDLATYDSGPWHRLLGAATLGYAQGDASIDGKKYDRRAVSLETNLFFRSEEDPILARAYAFGRRPECRDILRSEQPEGRANDANGVASPVGSTGTRGLIDVTASSGDVVASTKKCLEGVKKDERWNRSQISISYAAGWINARDGSRPEESLGRTLVIGVTYGMGEHYSAAATYRRSEDEPVLKTLDDPVIERVTSSLFVARLTGGTESMRLLIEGSNAKTERITATRRAFKRAAGLDVRVYEGIWLNIRAGRQRTIDGTSEETGTVLSLSYSPTALLKR